MMTTMAAAQVNRIRDYEQADAPAIARLFYETVRSVNRANYSDEQLQAWAPAIPDAGEWHDRMAGRKTLVAEEDGEVVHGPPLLRAAGLPRRERAKGVASGR